MNVSVVPLEDILRCCHFGLLRIQSLVNFCCNFSLLTQLHKTSFSHCGWSYITYLSVVVRILFFFCFAWSDICTYWKLITIISLVNIHFSFCEKICFLDIYYVFTAWRARAFENTNKVLEKPITSKFLLFLYLKTEY